MAHVLTEDPTLIRPGGAPPLAEQAYEKIRDDIV
jgi:hypothetical protein